MRPLPVSLVLLALAASGLSPGESRAQTPGAREPGLLFYLSGDQGTTADFSSAGTPEPTFASEVTPIKDGARGAALQCGDLQRLAWSAPGNIYAQRGTLAFFWRARYVVGLTEFPIFRVGYADHSSWDMVWLRIDYNGHGFDAFVTDVNLARTRVSVPLQPFPPPGEWIHLEIAGAAWGTMRLRDGAGDPVLFARARSGENRPPFRPLCHWRQHHFYQRRAGTAHRRTRRLPRLRWS
ncbi:MAG: hypothetical protein EXS32_05685 [Opitutus sp.]|nr:hypothetical protein [Opitutus sp.]